MFVFYLRMEQYNKAMSENFFPVSYNRLASDPEVFDRLLNFVGMDQKQRKIAKSVWEDKFIKRKPVRRQPRPQDRKDKNSSREEMARYFGTEREAGFVPDHWKTDGVLSKSEIDWVEKNEECLFAIDFIERLDSEI